MSSGPTCTANTGWKGHPRPCGLPATHYFEGEGEGGRIFMCDDHAILCSDQTGAESHPIAPG